MSLFVLMILIKLRTPIRKSNFSSSVNFFSEGVTDVKKAMWSSVSAGGFEDYASAAIIALSVSSIAIGCDGTKMLPACFMA